MFPNFSKQTVNIYRVKTVKPLEFELVERDVPFAEIERRQIDKKMEPLVMFPISQVQEMRRAYENDPGKSKVLVSETSETDSNVTPTDGPTGN